MTPSFSDLTYFYEAANALNLSQAAKKLGVTQPSLSIAINRLEKSLSAPLFIRHRQGVTLTQSGERLQLHVKELLDKWKNTQSSIDALSNQVSGKVSIGCHAALAPFISEIAARLLETYPQLEIQFKNDLSVRTTECVIAGTLDIGIVYDPIKHPDLVMKKITDIELTFWQGKDFSANREVVICDPQLAQSQALLRAYEKSQPIARLCTVNSHDMTAHLVACGAGVGILPVCVVKKQYTDKLQRLNDAPVYVSEMFLIYRSENRNMQAREVVLTALKQAIKR